MDTTPASQIGFEGNREMYMLHVLKLMTGKI